MDLILLFIRKNIRYRKANYILPFLSFVLSGILICTSVFYLTLAKNEGIHLPSSPYDITIRSDSRQEDLLIFEKLSGNANVVQGLVQEYVDLFPIISDEIATFDHDAVHSSIVFTSICASSPLAAFYEKHGCFLSELAPNEVFVTPYTLYYFQNHIRDSVLTLPVAGQDRNNAIHLNIVGIIDEQIAGKNNFSIVCSNDACFRTIRDLCGTNTSFHFYDFTDGFVHNAENYSRFLQDLGAGDFSFDVTIASRAPIEKHSSIYSGSIAIAAFNTFFAVICVISTLKLKFNSEVSDYQKLFHLGLSPVCRFLTPIIDISLLFIPSYVLALIFSVFLFQKIAPKTPQTYQSRIITNYFQYSGGLCIATFLLFLGCVLSIASILIVLCIVRKPKTYNSYIKKSASIYALSHSFILPYIFLHFRRHRRDTVFFIFIFCFPLFVSGMYGTAAINLVSGGNDVYADAAYIVSRNQVSYGNPITEKIVKDIHPLPGIESIHLVHKTNILYTFAAGNETTRAQIVELNDYTEEQFSKYLVAGNLREGINNPDAIAVVDNHARFSLGETLVLLETNRELTVSAILKNVPLEYRSLMYLADMSLLESLGQADVLPADIYICISDSISSADYAHLNTAIPSLIYDPHAVYFNQKAEAADLKDNGILTYRVAASMNLLISVISILSIGLFNTQKQANRAQEYAVLYKLGYSHEQIRFLIFAESFMIIGIGLLIFVLLYGAYVNSILRSIQSTQAYQYSDFMLAWKEIVSIALSVICVVCLSNRISYRSPRHKDSKT